MRESVLSAVVACSTAVMAPKGEKQVLLSVKRVTPGALNKKFDIIQAYVRFGMFTAKKVANVRIFANQYKVSTYKAM